MTLGELASLLDGIDERHGDDPVMNYNGELRRWQVLSDLRVDEDRILCIWEDL
jgi:hypothetical protein